MRKADAEKAEGILRSIEQELIALPSDISLAEANLRLSKSDGYPSLLKNAKDAIAIALLAPDPTAEPVLDSKGNKVPDPDLRGLETIPLPAGFDPEDDTIDVSSVGVDTYLAKEVLPHAPDAWVDHSKTKVGYEVPFTRVFYRYEPPRALEDIDEDIKTVEAEIIGLLTRVTE